MVSRLLKVTFLLSSFTLVGQNTAYWHFLAAYAKQQSTQVKGNLATFAGLTQPYAPLDIQITGAQVDQARQIKAFFFGIAASSSGIPVENATAMSNGFHCQGCAETRIRDLRKDIQEIRSLVDHFNRTPALVILAQWGTPGDFRFNSTFCLKSVTQEYLSDQGVFPGAVGKVYPDIAMALKPIGVSQAEIEGLIQQMSALHIVALVRTVEGIRAIRTGVTRSEAGVLFLQPKVPRPRPREEDNGIRINGFVQLTDDVYYFET